MRKTTLLLIILLLTTTVSAQKTATLEITPDNAGILTYALDEGEGCWEDSNDLQVQLLLGEEITLSKTVQITKPGAINMHDEDYNQGNGQLTIKSTTKLEQSNQTITNASTNLTYDSGTDTLLMDISYTGQLLAKKFAIQQTLNTEVKQLDDCEVDWEIQDYVNAGGTIKYKIEITNYSTITTCELDFSEIALSNPILPKGTTNANIKNTMSHNNGITTIIKDITIANSDFEEERQRTIKLIKPEQVAKLESTIVNPSQQTINSIANQFNLSGDQIQALNISATCPKTTNITLFYSRTFNKPTQLDLSYLDGLKLSDEIGKYVLESENIPTTFAQTLNIPILQPHELPLEQETAIEASLGMPLETVTLTLPETHQLTEFSPQPESRDGSTIIWTEPIGLNLTIQNKTTVVNNMDYVLLGGSALGLLVLVLLSVQTIIQTLPKKKEETEEELEEEGLPSDERTWE